MNMTQDKSSEIELFDKLSQEDYSEAREEDYQMLYYCLFDDYNIKNKTLLDVGCGTGINSIRLAKLGFKVTAIDLSAKAIMIAKEKAKQQNLDIKFMVGDIEHMPFPAYNFDVVFCGAILHHLLDMSKAAKEMFRVLKYNGRAISYDPNAHNPYGYFCHNILNKLFRLKYFTKDERALSSQELNHTFSSVGFINVRFFSLSMYTTKKGIVTRIIRRILYKLFITFLGMKRQGVFLVMVCEKEKDNNVVD